MMVTIEKLNSLDDRTAFTPPRPCSLRESGYGTWSSISRGLRPGQSVKTMTWFSPRSGTASTGVSRTAYTPNTVRAAATRRTTNRFRTDSSIRRSIMGGSLALWVGLGLPLVHLLQRLVRLVEGLLVAPLAADEHR